MVRSQPVVLYEDDWIAAIDKPSGLLTIPAAGRDRSLTGILNQNLTESKIPYRLHPCHRLDRETSGVILYAKGKAAQKKMMGLFKSKLIKKSYIAFVHGRLPRAQGMINRSIEGQSAITNYKTLEQRVNYSVVEVNPVTGRKNQIRIHFKGIGYPLVGESRFAFRKDFVLKAKRVLLHAAKISFMHPLTGKCISISSQLPRDMLEFLNAHP